MRRQQFFESWHRMTGVFSLVFSTSAIAVITANTNLGIVCAAVVALLQCIDLILDTRGKALLHNELRRNYIMLNSDMLDFDDNPTRIQHRSILKSIKEIEIKEPPVKKVLLEVAHNDACRSLGYPKQSFHDINWFVANTCNLINWPSSIKD